MQIFVAGATGALGRRIVPRLLAAGYRVTAAGRAPDRLRALEAIGASPLALDLLDAAAVRAAMRGHDAVINVATRVPPPNRMLMPGAWKEMARIRTEGSAIIADSAIANGVSRLVQESFAPVYPDRGSDWITEVTPIRPARHARSVADAEASATRFEGTGGVAVILRFAMLYGPGDPFVDTMVASVRKGWAPFIGDPDGYLSFVTHDDAAAAAVAALGAAGGVYNVVDDQPMTRRAIASSLAAKLGARTPRFLPRWIAHVGGSLGDTLSRSQRISNRKLRESSAWTPEIASVRLGIDRMLDKTVAAR